MNIHIYLVLFICFLVWGCDRGPTANDLLLELKSVYPSATIIESYVGEGDAEAVYIHIEFKTNHSASNRKEIWQYIKGSSGKWVRTNIEVR